MSHFLGYKVWCQGLSRYFDSLVVAPATVVSCYNKNSELEVNYRYTEKGLVGWTQDFSGGTVFLHNRRKSGHKGETIT